MGWQDAPIEEAPSWQTAPVEEQPQVAQPPQSLFQNMVGSAKAGAKSLVENIIPSALGIAGGAAGAIGGSAMGPLGTVAGGASLGYGGYKAGEEYNKLFGEMIPPEVKKTFGMDKETRARERLNYPLSTAAGEYGPDVASGVKGAVDLFKGTLKFAADKVVRNAAPEQQRVFPIAQEWGLELKPQQVTAVGDRQVIGNAKNQSIINQRVAEATGDPEWSSVKFVDKPYIEKRFEDLSKQYDAIYSQGPLILPRNVYTDIMSFVDDPVAKLGAAEKRSLQRLASATQSDPLLTGSAQNVQGKVFQDAMSKLKTVLRESNDPEQRRAVSGMLDKINTSMENYNPEIAKQLAELNPKFRATAVLSDLHHSPNKSVDVLGNVDAYELGRYLRNNPSQAGTNPLTVVGDVGEKLGIGVNKRGIRYAEPSGVDTNRAPTYTKLGLMQRMAQGVGDKVNSYNVTSASQTNPLLQFVKGSAGIGGSGVLPTTYESMFPEGKK